jgi:hypothetical protein
MAYVIRRLSSVLAVAGAILGIVFIGLLGGAGLPIALTVVIGLVPFLVAAWLATSLSAGDTGVPSGSE